MFSSSYSGYLVETWTSALQVVYDNESTLNLFASEPNQPVFHHIADDLVPTTDKRHFEASICAAGKIPLYRALLIFGWGEKEDAEIKAEYKIYRYLSDLQGFAIPRCYGYYSSTTSHRVNGNLVTKVGCLVLEYCHPDKAIPLDTEEYNRQIMARMCKIHAAGVEHRNIDLEGQRHILRYGSSPLIVDFSKARFHKCPGAKSAISKESSTEAACEELITLEENYGDAASDRAKAKPIEVIQTASVNVHSNL